MSRKVEIALAQLDAMADKEVLQLVLKLSESRGRGLCDKLLRRFGHAKKHSGWRLEGFAEGGRQRDDAHVREVANRVEVIRRRLRTAGEKKWAATLKTSGLRDMMSGVRKVAEEMRERCRADVRYVDSTASEPHRLIRAVFSNTNWSCHSHEGDNPFLVTPDNQSEAVTALERLVDCMVDAGGLTSGTTTTRNAATAMETTSMETTSSLGTSNDSGTCAGKRSVNNGGGGGTDVNRLWAVPSSVGATVM